MAFYGPPGASPADIAPIVGSDSAPSILGTSAAGPAFMRATRGAGLSSVAGNWSKPAGSIWWESI